MFRPLTPDGTFLGNTSQRMSPLNAPVVRSMAARWRHKPAWRITGLTLLVSTLNCNETSDAKKHDMAFKGKVADTRTVLVHLLLCLLIFYSLYYMIGSVCFGAFRLDHFDGLIPFDFKTAPTESNSKYLVNLLSMELTYFFSGLLFAAVVRRRVWDYAFTVTLLHVIITSLVMLEFPFVWQWWLALGSGLFLMICNGQLIAYFACQSDQIYPTISSY